MAFEWFDRLAKAFSRPATPTDRKYIAATVRHSDEPIGRYDSWNSRDMIRVGRAMFGSVANACNLIANAAARGELKLYRKTDDQPEEITEHPALDLIRNPDPTMTTTEWAWLVYWYREACGMCYIWTGSKRPSALYIFAPQYTRPIFSRTEGIEGYRYGRENMSPIVVPADEVIQTRWAPDPLNPLQAIAWPDSVAQYADMEHAAITSEVSRWRNGGQYGMIFGVDEGFTDDQLAQLRAAVAAKAGPNSAGSSMFIRKGTEVIQPNSKPHELNYEKGLEKCAKAIYGAAGIPESVWNLNQSIQSNAIVGNREWQRIIYERQSAFAADLSEWLLPMYGEDPSMVYFAYDNPVADDVDQIAARLRDGFNAGVVTVNEYRAALGLDPVEEELDTLGKAAPKMEKPNAQDQPKDEGESDTESETADGGEGGGSDPESEDSEDDPAGEGNGSASKSGAKKRFELVGRWEGCGCDRCKARKAFEPGSVEAAIEKVCRDWIANAMMTSVSEWARAGVFDPNLMDEKELASLIRESVRGAFEAGAEAKIEETGAPAESEIPHADATRYVEEYTADLVKDIAKTTREKIKAQIADGIAEGSTRAEIAAKIQETVPNASAQRAELIANTETARAYQHGALRQAQALGFDVKRWSLSGNPCGLCEGADKAIGPEGVPINEPYFIAGSTIEGTDGITYVVRRDVMVAADLHPNCKCTGIEDMSEGEQ